MMLLFCIFYKNSSSVFLRLVLRTRKCFSMFKRLHTENGAERLNHHTISSSEFSPSLWWNRSISGFGSFLTPCNSNFVPSAPGGLFAKRRVHIQPLFLSSLKGRRPPGWSYPAHFLLSLMSETCQSPIIWRIYYNVNHCLFARNSNLHFGDFWKIESFYFIKLLRQE